MKKYTAKDKRALESFVLSTIKDYNQIHKQSIIDLCKKKSLIDGSFKQSEHLIDEALTNLLVKKEIEFKRHDSQNISFYSIARKEYLCDYKSIDKQNYDFIASNFKREDFWMSLIAACVVSALVSLLTYTIVS